MNVVPMKHLDINAREIAAYAAKAHYAALAARCMEGGSPADQTERSNCMLYLIEIAEDFSREAEEMADKLAWALEQNARA